MRVLLPTTCGEQPRYRAVICALLIPLLVLSTISFDVSLTHEHDEAAEHTHFYRTCVLQTATDHHDHDGSWTGSGHSYTQNEECKETICCEAETESTMVVVNAVQQDSAQRGAAKLLIPVSSTGPAVGFLGIKFTMQNLRTRTFIGQVASAPIPVIQLTQSFLI